MNRILVYCIFCMIAFSYISCDDYLKDDSGDLLIPKTVLEYVPVLYKEGYPRTFNTDVAWVKLMTDDVEMGYLEKDPNSSWNSDGFDVLSGGEGRQAYIWHYNIEEKITDNNWARRYEDILGCNVIIDALPEMEYNPESELGKYNSLASQAYALRAYHYFCLVNTYALPWSKDNLDELGVIIRTQPQIDIAPRERSTIREVYELINEDIKIAQEYAAQAEVSINKHMLSPAAIQLLATRIALFQEDWETVIKIGTVFLRENSTILDLNGVDESIMGTDVVADFKIMDIDGNKEIVFTFGSTSSNYDFLSSPTTMWNLGFRVSHNDDGSLLKAYEQGDEEDLRLLAYFQQDIFTPSWWPGIIPDEWKYKYHYPIKYKSSLKASGCRENWRTVEVVLNVAEAYARQANDISSDAIQLINELRAKRIKTSTYVEKSVTDFANKEELVKFIWAERRRELCFEETMRFWDLRRQGLPQQIHRFYESKTSFETFVLPQGSKNYVLAIPNSELNANRLVTSNVREDIKAQ